MYVRHMRKIDSPPEHERLKSKNNLANIQQGILGDKTIDDNSSLIMFTLN